MVRDELLTSQGELRESKEELRAVKDELRDKTALLDGARREAYEAVNSAECLTEECRGLRGDLHQQVTPVAQRDEVTGRLRAEACTQWVSKWLAFQKKAVNAYFGLDFNFDLPSDKEAEESLSADYSGEPGTPVEVHSLSSPSPSPSDARSPTYIDVNFCFTYFLPGLGPKTYVAFSLINNFLPLLSLLFEFALLYMNCIDFLATSSELSSSWDVEFSS